jgi:spermidine/putrescine-binding protein
MMKEQGYLEKLDKGVVNNISNIDAAYLDKEFDRGNEYSVPYMAGAAVLCVNKSMVKDKITSYKQIFDPKFKNRGGAERFPRCNRHHLQSLGFSLNPVKDEELARLMKQMKILRETSRFRQRLSQDVLA